MSKINNEVEKPDDATLIIRRALNASPDRAVRAWTSPEHIQQWMRPEQGMTVEQVVMDLRVGGRFRIQMKKPDGEFFTAAGVFKEMTPPERLVYTWDWEQDGSGAEFGAVEGNPSQITVEFLKQGERTELVLTHSRFATVESRDKHAEGWSKCAKSFATFVEKK